MRARVAIVAAAAAAVVVAVLLVRDRSPDPGEGRALAARACSSMREVRDLVAADAAAPAVFAAMDRARDASDDAAERDPAWLPLASGIRAVRLALDEDDPEAAAIGIRVVATHCARAGAPIGASASP